MRPSAPMHWINDFILCGISTQQHPTNLVYKSLSVFKKILSKYTGDNHVQKAYVFRCSSHRGSHRTIAITSLEKWSS